MIIDKIFDFCDRVFKTDTVNGITTVKVPKEFPEEQTDVDDVERHINILA